MATANGDTLYTNTEIEAAIKNGYNVTLLRDTHGFVNVSAPITVNTNGYAFRYLSDSYVGVNSGTQISFMVGNVTVKWHVGNQVITEQYEASKIATFKGSLSEVNGLTYVKNEGENGVTFSIFATGWSKTEDGRALSSAEMVVTATNCEFWLVNKIPVDCLFVKIDSSGAITKYNSENDLRGLLSSGGGTYDIVLCRDVELKTSSAITIAKSGKTLYLNGFTISHKQNDVHLFYYNNGATGNFNIIGPGTIEAVGSRTIFTSYSSTVDKTSAYGFVARNVTFKTNGQLADLRIGQHVFTKCTLIQTDTNKALFALWNKNENFLGGGVPENLLTVTFDECLVSASAGLISYSASSYSRVYVQNSEIKLATYLLDSASTILYFEANGETSIIANSLFSNNSGNYTGVIFRDGVACNFVISTSYLDNGTALTNNYNAALPYRVSDDYAKVTWKNANGEILLTELVPVGVSLRTSNPVIAEYLKNDGRGYTYNLITVSGNEDITLSPVANSSAPIKVSMTVHNDLTMYLYIEKAEMDTYVQSVKVGGTRIMSSSYEIVDIDGITYYKYAISTFKPAKASEVIDIIVEYSDGGVTALKTSAVNYLEDLLVISNNDAEKTLIVKLLKYIQSAQIYFNSTSVLEQERISGIIEQYKQYDLVFGNLRENNVATGTMRNVIRSVCFNLSASVRMRFYLNPTYTGTLTVLFNGTTSSYVISNGLINGCDYIEIIMPADSINGTLELSDGQNTVYYGLNAYATSINKMDHTLYNMLVCLSEYSSAATYYLSK